MALNRCYAIKFGSICYLCRMKKKLAILASGTGSNAAQLVQHFANHSAAEVAVLISNNPHSGIFALGQTHGVATVLHPNEDFVTGEAVVTTLQAHQVDLIVLAGFLRKIPTSLISAYPNRIINIHPALLPDFGGKGMYGKHVHEAVRQSGTTRTGITIHLVDQQYDHGAHLAQYTCPVEPTDSAEDIAKRVQKLEHAYYPVEVEKYVEQLG
jgi:phosphoribosylglycinamide formyltransferase 1